MAPEVELPSPKLQPRLAPAGTLVEELESKLTTSPAFGAPGEKVNFACRTPPLTALRLILAPPEAPEQPLLVADRFFRPSVDHYTEMLLPVELPVMVPPSGFQLQPVAPGVQLVAEAEKA